ncbi:MAG: SufS family cysteine desulfurase [Eubacterium sp.]|nr:SufS family cysteine desulfurase [Eubacterium sp.]
MIRSIEDIRKDFPFFRDTKLAYLDNSATSQRPESVLDKVKEYYLYSNANPFRGLYDLSITATEAYEAAREKVAGFINARESAEVIFTRNASESLNLAAYSLGALLSPGDEIVTSVVEHHSNLLPWQHAAKRAGAVVKYLTPEADGSFAPEKLEALMSEKTRIVALTAMSNIFGQMIDVKALAEIAHRYGAFYVADGSQSVPHGRTDVQALDCDLLAFSGHKMLAPMGIGVLYGKREVLEKMPPFLTGGEMIENVSLEEVTYAEIPHKFEAGTVNAGGAIGLAAAIDYIESIGIDQIEERERELSRRAFAGIKEIPHIILVGSDKAEEHHGIFTFKVEGVHPHDVAAIMAEQNVAVRAGHHCAEPLHHFLQIPSTTRASLMFYNTEEEVDQLTEAMKNIRPFMGYPD